MTISCYLDYEVIPPDFKSLIATIFFHVELTTILLYFIRIRNLWNIFLNILKKLSTRMATPRKTCSFDSFQ